MFRSTPRHRLNKVRSRTLRNKPKAKHIPLGRTKSQSLSFHERLRKLLVELRRSASRISPYTIKELEPICQQLAIQQMSSTTTISSVDEICPLVCSFCRDLIHDPLTLSCGHTFCEQCITDEQISSTRPCPRCPDDVQGQTQSSVVNARQCSFHRNHFLKQIFERSELLRMKYELNLLYNKGKTAFNNQNYTKATEIYSQIIEQDHDHHLAFYGRAKAYFALNQYDDALADASRVVSLKPQWTKGHLCQSEIYFALNHFTSALMSSLKALVLDPEDPLAKPIMARHLHAVLHNDEQRATSEMDAELESLRSMNASVMTNNQNSSSTTADKPLTMCKSKHEPNTISDCLCDQFDYKNLRSRDFECSICVNLLWLPITTPCGHVFCRECLIRSVDNTQIQCPMCKTSLEQFFPLVIGGQAKTTELISKIIETYFPAELEERQQLNEQENMQGTILANSILNDTDNTAPIIVEIPIFVCVLALPNCTCPLHVFEPRYRLMMRRTMETESRTFGMCTYDEQTGDFSDYGTLLYIRNLMYTQDGRSIVDTIGQRRFRVLERGMKDGYCTAKVELIRDHPIEQHEFDDLFQLNRTTYNRVRTWFNRLDPYRRTIIARQLEGYPTCDDLVQGSTDGPSWAWIMLNLLPIDSLLQYTAVASQSFRIRLQMINDVVDFLNQQQQNPPGRQASTNTQ